MRSVALDAWKIAEFEANLPIRRVSRLSSELGQARSKLGIQIPVDELVFLSVLPVRVEAIQATVGDAVTGTGSVVVGGSSLSSSRFTSWPIAVCSRTPYS